MQDEVAQACSDVDVSRTASTRRAYEADWTWFTAWCMERDLVHLPSDARAVAAFLSGKAARGCAPPTVNRRLAVIHWAHRRAGLQPPQKTEGAARIAEVLAGIRRSRTTVPDKKPAADADVTRTFLHYIKDERLRDHRDRALITLSMVAALRRSELVSLWVRDLQRVAGRLRVRVARSKTDQDGAGEVVFVPNGKRLRPVALVEAWLRTAHITDGFVFRRFVSRADHLSELPMDDAGVALGAYLLLDAVTAVVIGGGLAWLSARLAIQHAGGPDVGRQRGVRIASGFLVGESLTGAAIAAIDATAAHAAPFALTGPGYRGTGTVLAVCAFAAASACLVRLSSQALLETVTAAAPAGSTHR